MTNLPLFPWTAPLRFDGPDVTPADTKRLGRQLNSVRSVMLDGAWRSLAEIASATGYPEASISARLRDCRKARNGSLTVERRRRGEGGTWEYRVTQ